MPIDLFASLERKNKKNTAEEKFIFSNSQNFTYTYIYIYISKSRSITFNVFLKMYYLVNFTKDQRWSPNFKKIDPGLLDRQKPNHDTRNQISKNLYLNYFCLS